MCMRTRTVIFGQAHTRQQIVARLHTDTNQAHMLKHTHICGALSHRCEFDENWFLPSRYTHANMMKMQIDRKITVVCVTRITLCARDRIALGVMGTLERVCVSAEL